MVVFISTIFRARASVVIVNLNTNLGSAVGIVRGTDGNFYGTTETGGTHNLGTVFKLTTNGTLTTLYSFSGNGDGATPSAGLVQGNNGYFYGVTYYNTVNGGNGTVFKISTDGLLIPLHAFNGTDGAHPEAEMIRASDGTLYGTTGSGGVFDGGSGTIFKIGARDVFTSAFSFSAATGYFPRTRLVQGSDGNFYGTTYAGGTNAGGFGTVFRFTTNGAVTTLHSFNGPDGEFPQSGLVQGGDGNFYGTTSEGGTNQNYGTVFKMTTNGTFTTLHHFGGNDGVYPISELLPASDGNLYGTTESSIFKITVNGGFTSLYPAGGIAPLVLANGNFYGLIGGFSRFSFLPVFLTTSFTNHTLTMTWSTEPGWKYQLQYNSNLTITNWINLGAVITATGTNLTATDSTTNNAHRCYRVGLIP